MQRRFTLLTISFLVLFTSQLHAGLFTTPPVADTLVTILGPDTVFLCRGDTLRPRQTNNVNDSIVWILRPEGDVEMPMSTDPLVRVQTSGYLVLGAGPGLDDCDFQDSIYLDVNNFVVPDLIADTTICEGDEIRLTETFVADQGETLYDWKPGTFFDDSLDVNVVFRARFGLDTVFTLVAESENGVCSDSSQSVRVRVISSEVRILEEDTLRFCRSGRPDTTTLTAQIIPLFGLEDDLRWFPTEGIIGSNEGLSIDVAVTEDRVYYAEATVNGCYQVDSVEVRVDSLPPDMTVMLTPEKDPYCPGDTIFLRSPTYEVLDYPLITHRWANLPAIQSPEELYGAVAFAVDTVLAERINENGACLDTTFTQINVIKPPIPSFEPDRVCPGETTQITVEFDPSRPGATFTWMDPGGLLSCTDCLEPQLTTDQPATFEIEMIADGSECPFPASYSVGILRDVEPTLNNQVNVCPGDNRRIITGGLRDDHTYRIIGPDQISEDPNLVVTLTEDATFTVETTGPCEVLTSTVTFRVFAQPTVSIAGDLTVCSGNNLVLTATADPNLVGSYVWTGGNINGSVTGATLELEDPASGTYTVTYVDNACGRTVTEEVVVEVIDQDLDLELVGLFNDMNLMPGDSVFEGANGVVNLFGAEGVEDFDVVYTSNINGSGNGTQFSVSIPRENAPDTLGVSAELTTREGCVFSANVRYQILESAYSIPEIISPNGDGTNDEFRVFFSGELDNFSLSVYNRWGQEVFESNDPTRGWDGTKNGHPQNIDTYLYYARFTQNGVDFVEEGQFVLVR